MTRVVILALVAILIVGCGGIYQPPGEDLWLYLSVVEKL